MSKKVKVLLWILGVLLIILVAGGVIANYAIDKVLGTLSTSSEVSTQVNPTPEDKPDESDVPGDTQLEANEQASASEDDSSTETPTESNKPTDKVTENNNSSAEKQASNGYTAEINEEKAKAIEEEVKLTEKAKVASILLGSLSTSDINTLQELASGGLTVEEKKAARDILLQKLTEEQYNELIEIAAKYGVSQGKKYSEVK